MKIIRTMSEAECAAIPATQDEAGFGTLLTSAGNLPLRKMDVDVRIIGLVSSVELRQAFVNSHDVPLEASYIFPLPSRAAVQDFRLRVGDREICGVLKERGQARAEYKEAIQEGKRAAIAEEERPDVFTMRVGNIMPGESAEVVLSFSGPLQLVDSEATFRFPLVVAPRYIPGIVLPDESVGLGVSPDTDAVPDASRITPPVLLPGYPNPVALALRVELDPAGLDIGEPRSSLQTVSLVAGEEQGEGSDGAPGCQVLRLEPGERLNRDFILRFDLNGTGIGDSLVLQPDAAATDEGTFLLTLTPPPLASVGEQPRDVVFVLDRSGSMGGWKMVAARRALARMLDTLNDGDRVNVLAFDDLIEVPHEGLEPATDRRRYQTIEFLSRIEARGGTEMLRPIERALELLQATDGADQGERQRVLVLVTDGQIGNEDQLLRNVKLDGTRVFTLGIDRAVNEGFLQRFARQGGGEFELVETEARLDEVMDRIHRRVCRPVLTDLSLRADGVKLDFDSLEPGRLPDLFAGSPLLLFGRYRAATADPVLSLSATAADGQSFTTSLRGSTIAEAPLTSLWARARIRSLEDRYAISSSKKLSKSIVDTSLRFGVLSRFTAFVAVDQKVVNEGGKLHEVIQPIEQPDGWDALTAACAPVEMERLFLDSLSETDLGDPSGIYQSSRKISSLRMRSRFGAVSDLSVSLGGRKSRVGKLSRSKPRDGGAGEGGSDDLRLRIEAAVEALTCASQAVDDLDAELRELLSCLIASELGEERHAQLVELLAELTMSGLHPDLGQRLAEVLGELLADLPARAEFWK